MSGSPLSPDELRHARHIIETGTTMPPSLPARLVATVDDLRRQLDALELGIDFELVDADKRAVLRYLDDSGSGIPTEPPPVRSDAEDKVVGLMAALETSVNAAKAARDAVRAQRASASGTPTEDGDPASGDTATAPTECRNPHCCGDNDRHPDCRGTHGNQSR